MQLKAFSEICSTTTQKTIVFIVTGVKTSNLKSLSVLCAIQHTVEQCIVPLPFSIIKTLTLGTSMPNYIKWNSTESKKLMSGNVKHTTMTNSDYEPFRI
jgi:hypothetical protein